LAQIDGTCRVIREILGGVAASSAQVASRIAPCERLRQQTSESNPVTRPHPPGVTPVWLSGWVSLSQIPGVSVGLRPQPRGPAPSPPGEALPAQTTHS